jgi:superfamily II DNA or RNA helicase
MNDYKTSKLYQNKKSNYIDLRINGRLFPTWILENFKDYKLPEVIKTAVDPCNTKEERTQKAVQELRKYQVFISKYLDFRSPYKNILIYHGLGSGKTASAINIYNLLYN